MTARRRARRYSAWQMIKAASGAVAIVALFTFVAAEVAVRRPVMAGCGLAVLLFYAGALTWAEASESAPGAHRAHARHRAPHGGEHRGERAA